MTEEWKKKISEGCKKRYALHPKTRSHCRVYWVEADKYFDSAEAAAKWFGCTKTTIYKVLRGIQKTINGDCHLKKA